MAAISVTRKLVQHCANTLNGVASKKGQGHTEIKQQKLKRETSGDLKYNNSF